MNLRRFFKKEKESAASAVAVAPAPIAKPASERYGKTVLPSTARYAEPPNEPVALPPSIAPISLPALAPAAPRTISLGEKPAASPKIAAPIPTAPGERMVVFLLSEIAPQIPPEVLAGVEIDPLQRIHFNAAKLERGMANGRPAVLLGEIFRQAPGIFAAPIAADDAREVALPFEKVLEHFTRLQVRGDQQREETRPEFETLFSQMTREDIERFAASAPNPIKAQPAENAAPKNTDAPEAPPEVAPPALKLSPHGTGAPASEGVPASSGSPVPIPLPAPFAPAVARKISFKPEPAQSEFATHPAISDALEPLPTLKAEARISLSLPAALKELAPSQLTGQLDEIPAETRIEFPLAQVKAQLSLGKVEIPAKQFHAALPEAFRAFFKLDDAALPVPLPLAEVLQNLPNESLHLRYDQVEAIVPQIFETPFSQKAAEDAARLKIFGEPIASAPPENPPLPAPAEPTPLQQLLETDDTLDPKSIVAHLSRLPGVSACVIVFSDGLSLAGNIPSEFNNDAICALIPENNYHRAAEFAQVAGFGPMESITLCCAKSCVSFFTRGDICLTVLHSGGLAGETHARLGRIAEELARMFATGKPAPSENA